MFLKFLEKKKPRLFLEVGSEWVKWCVSSGEGVSAKILDIGAAPLTRGDSSLSGKVAELLRKYRFEAAEVVSAIPRYQVTARNMEVPSTQVEEIKKIIDLQAVKKTPYGADEIVYDYHLLDTFREGYSSLMLVVVHRPVLNEHLLVLDELGLKSECVTLTTECAVLWMASHWGGPARDEAVAVLDVDLHASDFFIYQGPHLLFTQSISIGAERMKAADEEWHEKLWAELSRSFQIYRSEEIAKEPAFLALAGACQELKSSEAALSKLIGLPVREAEPEPEVKKLFETEEALSRLSFSSLVGMAKHPKRPPINLVPQEIAIKAGLMEKGKSLLTTGVLSLSIFVMAIGIFASRQLHKQAYLKWLQDKAVVTQSTAEQADSTRQKIQAIMNLNDFNEKLFQAILQLHRVAPKDLYLTDMTMSKDRNFEIQGRAESMTTVFEFVNNLKVNKVFKETETRRLTKRMVDNKEVVDFEIHSRLAQESPALRVSNSRQPR